MQPYSLAASRPEWSSLKFHIDTKKRWFEQRWYTASVQFFGFLCLYLEDVLVDASSLLPSSKLSFLQTNPWLYLKDKTFVCKHILTVDEGTVVPFHHVRVNLFPHGPIRLTYRAMFRWLSHACVISLILLMDTTLHPLGGSKTRCCNWVHFHIQYSHHIDWFRILSINHTALCNILCSVPSHRADFSQVQDLFITWCQVMMSNQFYDVLPTWLEGYFIEIPLLNLNRHQK